MTETLPVLRREPDPEYDRLARIGQWLAASEAGGNDPRSREMTAALRLYYARELGLPPFAAAELSVIKGNLFVSAKLLRAMGAQRGYRVVKTDSSPEACTAVLVELSTGVEVGRTTYTIVEAKAAGLVRDGSSWKTHPGRMLWARASKFVLDDYAPEVTLGIYTEEEGAEIVPGSFAELPDEPQDDIPWPDALEPDPPDPSEFPPAPGDEPPPP